MKKIFFAMATIAAAVVFSLSSTAAASAETLQAAPAPAGVSAASADVDIQQSCQARFADNVNHRASASSGSTSLGVIPANTWVPASCTVDTGDSYSACGQTTFYWLRVYWNGSWGYSVYSCLRNWE